MSARLAKFRALSWAERKVLLAAAALMPMFWVALRVFGLARFQAWLEGSPMIGRALQPAVNAERIGALVNIAGEQLPFPSTCLTRSMLLNWLLRRRGMNSVLRIGVRLNQRTLEAHAWVELEGKPVNDAQDVSRRYAAFDGPLSPNSFLSR